MPGPGEVGLDGKGLKEIGFGASTSRAVAGGEVRLRIAPGKKGKKAKRLRRRLHQKGKAKVKVTVTYLSTGGVASSQSSKLKLLDE